MEGSHETGRQSGQVLRSQSSPTSGEAVETPSSTLFPILESTNFAESGATGLLLETATPTALAAHGTALLHAATHCNTLQHAATVRAVTSTTPLAYRYTMPMEGDVLSFSHHSDPSAHWNSIEGGFLSSSDHSDPSSQTLPHTHTHTHTHTHCDPVEGGLLSCSGHLDFSANCANVSLPLPTLAISRR